MEDLDLLEARIKTRVYQNLIYKDDVTFTKKDLDRCYILEDLMADNIIFRIRKLFVGDKMEKYHIQHPLDWWEAFKERWFPKWLTKRYPVKYKTHIISFDILYPNYEPGPGKTTTIYYQDSKVDYERFHVKLNT